MAQQNINLGTVPNDATGDGLRDGGTKINDNFTELYGRTGFFDYNDLATTGTPISITGGAGFVNLTNDEAGAFTNKTYAPAGVTDVWDSTGMAFDWTELDLGDTVDIRLDITIVTASVNTAVECDLFLGTGGSAYQIPFITQVNFKDIGSYTEVIFNGIYMGDSNTLDNGGVFKVSADKTCTVIVNGWYVRIIRRHF